MPTYTFCCDKCKHKFELFFTIETYKDKQLCEKCGTSANRSYEDDLGSISASIKLADSEVKTLDHLAKRNNEKFSDDQKHHLYIKHNSYKEGFDKSKSLPAGMKRIDKPKLKTKWTDNGPTTKRRKNR
jgi:putative FmdB family regulatory protein